ncbi:MAG: flavin reductase family protein [Pseudomonadota bacterium]
MDQSFDDKEFRSALGRFATGVVVVSTFHGTRPEGMTIGAFTSVSLAPPLIAFLPAKSSTTWPKIREAKKFTINILAHDQQELCKAFARSSEEKYSGVPWDMSEHGTPHLAGALGWLDCTLYGEFEAGDHDIALGHVSSITQGKDRDPLVFFGGQFHTLDASETVSKK